jgi:hypothetical protein
LAGVSFDDCGEGSGDAEEPGADGAEDVGAEDAGGGVLAGAGASEVGGVDGDRRTVGPGSAEASGAVVTPNASMSVTPTVVRRFRA